MSLKKNKIDVFNFCYMLYSTIQVKLNCDIANHTTQVILHSLQEMTSERQVILDDPSITSMGLMVQNGRKCITYNYYLIKQLLLTYVSVDMNN